MGGLGNQLFQIFTTLSYGIRAGNPYIFLKTETLGGNGTKTRNTYWETLFNELPVTNISNILKYNFLVLKEINFNYNDFSLLNFKNKNVYLYGYFQSYHYFKNEKNTIIKTLKIQEKINLLLSSNNITSSYFDNTISIHFRRDDYKNIQDYHPVLDYDYYESSLNYILNFTNKSCFKAIFFCQDEDYKDILIIINLLKDKFKSIKFERCKDCFNDWEQLLLMSLCSHNIIANSSFSWWGAFLNENKMSLTCYPSIWFGPSITYNTNDLLLPSWKKIETKYNYKIYSKFILFHQPKTAGTYVGSCLPEGYVLPHSKNYHHCLNNNYLFLNSLKIAIIRNPIDYYISLITFWCLDSKYCKELEDTSILNVKYNLAKSKSEIKHLNFWISNGFTERNLDVILNNILSSEFQKTHSDKLCINHHTYDYFIFDILNKLNIGYYTFAFLDQYSSKKITEFNTEEDCNAEIINIKKSFRILNQHNISFELENLCNELDVPFKNNDRKMASNRKSPEKYNFGYELIHLIYTKDRLMFNNFDLSFI
jgi:hypothetical protein